MNYGEMNPQIEYFICRHTDPSWIIEDATISFVDLAYVFKGKVYYYINGVKHEVSQGNLICLPKGSRRSALADAADPAITYAVNFQLYDIKGADITLPFPFVSYIGHQEELLSLYNELSVEWLKKAPGYEIKSHALLLLILYYYFKLLYYQTNYSVLDQRIQIAVKYILTHLQNQLAVEELASIAGLTTAYFGTLFKKNVGSSVKEYINKMKINNAENILLSGEFSVQEAAYKCGFEDIFYFSKLFKRIRGFPPSSILLKRKIPHSDNRSQ